MITHMALKKNKIRGDTGNHHPVMICESGERYFSWVDFRV